MGVDTKGCLVTEFKNPFKVAEKVCARIRGLMQKETGVKGFLVNYAEGYKLPKVSMSEWCEMLSVQFLFKGEERDIKIHFDCDCDLENHEEIDGSSCIWFSMGCWGSSEILMQEILDSVKEYGRIYIDLSDCDDYGFEEIK